MNSNLLYELSPFIVSSWFKLVLWLSHHRLIQRSLQSLPGATQLGLTHEGTAKNVARYVSHGLDKVTVILGYLGSVFAAAVYGVKEGIGSGGVLGALLLVLVGAGIHSLIMTCEDGTLDTPLFGARGPKRSTVVFVSTIFVDVVLAALVMVKAAMSTVP